MSCQLIAIELLDGTTILASEGPLSEFDLVDDSYDYQVTTDDDEPILIFTLAANQVKCLLTQSVNTDTYNKLIDKTIRLYKNHIAKSINDFLSRPEP